MLRNAIALCILLVALAAPLTSFAQTDSVTPTATTKKSLKDRVLEKQELMQEKKEEAKERVQEARKEAKERFLEKREEFKEKLSQLKDARKQAVVERIDEKMASVNEKRTEQMSQAVARLKEILTTIEAKAATEKASGKDTSAVDQAITDAKTALSDAETAITTQAGKEYVITIGTESTLRTNVGQTVSQLQQDLKATHQTVVSAKRAVKVAAAALRNLKTGEKTDDPTASSAAQ